MKDMGNIYEKFRSHVNKINESYNIEHMPLMLKKSLIVYELFWRLHFEKGYSEISEKLYDLLTKAVYVIKKGNIKYTSYLGNIEEILEYFTVLTLHKF